MGLNKITEEVSDAIGTKYDTQNVFAKILRGETPCKKVSEDEHVLAFHDIYPEYKTHVLVIPKKEHLSFDDFIEKSSDQEIADFFRSVKKVATSLGISEYGYKLLSNHKSSMGQQVFHFHVHLMSNIDIKTTL